jgi:spore germination cell wall hydrolase CwlJ-like protein
MRHSRIRGLPAARDHTVMRELRIRDLPAAADKLGTSFIIVVIVVALFWSYQLHQIANERDYLIRTIVFEASGETEIGKVAVAYAVINRKKRGRWGDTIKSVVTSPGQFEPWMTQRKAIERLSLADPRYQSAAIIADAVLSGRAPDPTAGATHFLNPVIVRARRGGSLPSWASGGGRPIGRHVFYCPDERGRPPQRATRSLSAMADRHFLLTSARD